MGLVFVVAKFWGNLGHWHWSSQAAEEAHWLLNRSSNWQRLHGQKYLNEGRVEGNRRNLIEL